MRPRLVLVSEGRAGKRMLEAALAELGPAFEGVHAESSQAARAALSHNVPSVFAVHSASDERAIASLRALREMDDCEALAVIVLHSGAPRERRLRALEAGADDVFDAPLDGELLRARVRCLLARELSRVALRNRLAELAERNVALERVQREHGELMTFIVHDLKTPLSVVGSSLDFVREQLPVRAGPVSDSLIEATRAAGRLRSMVDDLLTMARLEDSSFQLNMEAVPVGEVVGEVVREYLPIAEDKHVQLLSPGTAPARARTDRTLLQRVLENIVDNSVRYTPTHGRVSVATDAGRDVTIAVSNSGPAIPASQRSRIFEKYARLDVSGAMRGNAGVGLYFCKRAVEALGGGIEVTETAEWPTSFVVHLPSA